MYSRLPSRLRSRSQVTLKVPLALAACGDLREKFQRDDEIDRMDLDEFARIIKDKPQSCTAEEDTLVNKASVKLGMLEWENFEELESRDHLVKMGKMFFDGSSSVVVRATTTVDVSVEECAAWDMAAMSRKRVKDADTEERSLTRSIDDHSSVLRVTYDFKIPGFKPREFISTQVWRRQGDDLTVVYEPTGSREFPPSHSLVRGTTAAHTVYERRQPVGGLPQTRVTWTNQTDLGGLIPKSVVNSGAVRQLMYLSTMRKFFDKSLDIDGVTRARNVEMITGHSNETTEEEERILAEEEKHFADFKEMKAKVVKMKSPLARAEVAFQSGDKHAWGWATATVRATPEEVLAFNWDTMMRSARREDDLEKSVDEERNGHNQLVYVKKRTPKIIADRDFLGRVVWKKKGEGFVFATNPEESSARPRLDGVVRGIYPSAMRINRKNDKETTLEYFIHPDAGGRLPSWLANSWIGSSLSFVTEIQEYFQALRRLEEWDEEDGRCVGEAMCMQTLSEKYPENGESKQRARMRALFKQYKGLEEIAEKYEFFQPMMTRVVENKLWTSGDVKSKLCSVSSKEGETIGRGLAMALATNLTAEAGVDEWIGRCVRERSEASMSR